MILRPARSDEADTLLAIQREAAVNAFAHVYPPERYPFPDDAIREVWAEALADPDVEVHVAVLDGAAVGAVSVGRGYLSCGRIICSRGCDQRGATPGFTCSMADSRTRGC